MAVNGRDGVGGPVGRRAHRRRPRSRRRRPGGHPRGPRLGRRGPARDRADRPAVGAGPAGDRGAGPGGHRGGVRRHRDGAAVASEGSRSPRGSPGSRWPATPSTRRCCRPLRARAAPTSNRPSTPSPPTTAGACRAGCCAQGRARRPADPRLALRRPGPSALGAAVPGLGDRGRRGVRADRRATSPTWRHRRLPDRHRAGGSAAHRDRGPRPHPGGTGRPCRSCSPSASTWAPSPCPPIRGPHRRCWPSRHRPNRAAFVHEVTSWVTAHLTRTGERTA